MAKKQVYCVNVVLRKTFKGTIDVAALSGWFFMASSENEAVDMLLKQPEGMQYLKQGYLILAHHASVVRPGICPVNEDGKWSVAEWSVAEHEDKTQVLSLKLNEFPEEAIADLQQFADKWLDGCKL